MRLYTHTHTDILNNSGITLVALVVTIVVLLVLAMLSISLVVGENGLIAKAKEAKEKYEQSQLNDIEDIDAVVEEINTILLPSTEETQPYLPNNTFLQIEGTNLDNGLVIKDKNGNEYVWIEVPKSITKNSTDDDSIKAALESYAIDYRRSDYTDTWYDGTRKNIIRRRCKY